MHALICTSGCVVRVFCCRHCTQHQQGLALLLFHRLTMSKRALQIHKIIRARYLTSGSDQVFLCPFVVRIECCWLAKFDYQWGANAGKHHLRSCSVCPPIPVGAERPASVLCNDLDSVLSYFTATEAVSLTDLLLMAGSASPTPSFHMLVQYVATLCRLHSVPQTQPQLRRQDQQVLDISELSVLVHGHKSLVVHLGDDEKYVYKVLLTHSRQHSVLCL